MAYIKEFQGYLIKDEEARESISINTVSIDKLNGMVNGALINVENGVDITDSFKDVYNSLDNETGGTIYIKSGEYIIRPLRIGNFVANEPNTHNIEHLPDVKPLRIIGLGDVTLKLADNSNGDMFLFGSHDKGTYFENITFDGNNENQSFNPDICFWQGYQTIILMFRCENITFKNCNFINSNRFGLNASKDCYNVHVDGCKFENCHTPMDFIAHGCFINNVYISNTCVNGIYFESVERAEVDFNYLIGINDNIVVENSKIESQQNNIRTIWGTYNITIRNVIAKYISFDASACGTNIGLKKGLIENCISEWIFVGNGKDVIIKDNIVTCGASHPGININHSENIHITNNTAISDNSSIPVYLNGVRNKNIFVSNNDITSNSTACLKIDYGDRYFINDNSMITNYDYALFLDYPASNVHIINNILEANVRGVLKNRDGVTFSMKNNIGDGYTTPNIEPYVKFETVASLPTPSADYKNMVIVLSQLPNTQDATPYFCSMKKDNTYEWKPLT